MVLIADSTGCSTSEGCDVDHRFVADPTLRNTSDYRTNQAPQNKFRRKIRSRPKNGGHRGRDVYPE